LENASLGCVIRPNVVEEDLVVTVRAYTRRDLAEVILPARPEAENHPHAAIEALARTRRITRRRVTMVDLSGQAA
jgi:hypothetical protein